MPGHAAAAHAPIEHAGELVQMLSADGDEHPIEAVVIRRTGDEESDRIPVTDDAKAPILVGKVGMERRIGLEPGSRPRSTAGVSGTTRRISRMPSGKGSRRSSIAHSKPDNAEPARCQNTSPTSAARSSGYRMASKR